MKKNPLIRFRYPFILLIGAVLFGVVSVAVAYSDALHEKSEAARFLLVLSTIEVGSSPQNRVLEMLKPFVRYENGPGNPDQGDTATWIEYTFRNRVMASLHLAPPKFVYAGIEFRDGIVVKKSVNFYQQPRSGVVVQEVMASGASGPASNNSRQLRTNVYGPKSSVIDVHDDTSVPLSRRQLDWQIDFSCMTTMNFCANPQEMLPGIFPR